MLTSAGPRGAPRRRARHRRRGPRDRRLQARRAPRAEPRAARARSRAARRAAAAADRPVGHPAAARDDRALPRRASGRAARSTIVDAGARKPLELQVDRPGRGHGRPRRGPAARRAARRARRPAATCADEHLAGDPPADPRADPAATAARSSSPTAGGSRSGSPSASTSWPARSSSGPTTAASPASSGSTIEEELKAGRLPALVATSQPRARHRHGRRRPRDPGRERRPPSRAGSSGSGGPATRSARRRKGVIFPKYRGDLLEVRGRDAADARGRHRDDGHARATRSTCSPSSSSR